MAQTGDLAGLVVDEPGAELHLGDQLVQVVHHSSKGKAQLVAFGCQTDFHRQVALRDALGDMHLLLQTVCHAIEAGRELAYFISGAMSQALREVAFLDRTSQLCSSADGQGNRACREP